MKTASMSLFGLLALGLYGASVRPMATIPSGSAIYVDSNNGFDIVIAEAFKAKRLPIRVVASPAKAGYTLDSTAFHGSAGVETKRFATTARTSDVTMTLTDKAGAVVWAFAVTKGIMAQGDQSVAEACAKHLRDYIANDPAGKTVELQEEDPAAAVPASTDGADSQPSSVNSGTESATPTPNPASMPIESSPVLPALNGPGTAQISSKPLTNLDVIALAAAGFSDHLIIAKIKGAPAAYKIDIDDIIELKKAHLSESVIQAMMTAVLPPPPAPAPALPPAPVATVASTKPRAPDPAPKDPAPAPPAAPTQAAAAQDTPAPAPAPSQAPAPAPATAPTAAGATADPPKKGIIAKLKGVFSNPSDNPSGAQAAAPEPAAAPSPLASVTVISRPAGAIISVDGYFAGRTPAVVKLMPGTYTMTLKADGLPSYSQKIVVEPGQVRSFGVVLDSDK